MRKRTLSFIIMLIFLYTACIGRISYIIFGGDYQVSSGYNSYKLVLDSIDENILDCNMKKLNNNKTKLVAVIKPDEKCLSELNLIFNSKEISEIAQELSKGIPIVKNIKKHANCKYIKIIEVIDDKPLNFALLSIINEINLPLGEKSISFAVDANGRILNGDNEKINNNNYYSKKGIQLSINRDIQSITDCEIADVNSGAIVVMDCKNNNVLAMSSIGGNGINRCLSQYAVGSIFKLIVAACAIENNIELNYYCNGEITVGDTTFACMNKAAHKQENMQTALDHSCNCYFIKLALTLGSDRLYKTACDFGFGCEFQLFDNYSVKASELPDIDDLNSKGELALLGFGQGKLTASPLAFCNAICAVADGGLYSKPNLLLGTVDDEGNWC